MAKSRLHWDTLMAIEPRADEWFGEINPIQSCLAYDGGKRFGIMTTNMAESWNNAIKASRKLPITALVTSLFYKVVTYFDQRRVEIEKQSLKGNEFTKHANQMLSKWIKRASGHHVKLFDRNTLVFEVITMKHGQKGGNKQIVQHDRICTCNKWQTYHIPCSHVLACCASVGLQYTSFIDNCYKLENARKVYVGHFQPIQKQSDWPLMIYFPLLMHDDENISRKLGRRKETRYKNEMDYQALRKGKNTSYDGASSSVP
ncbi:SWIM-type domain-containing protein [Heracleum sosnowskyi]|uniref:SWIM-type domain-containing protein n=1 Tax=Heracleum sosnowskyi TaxID=360622 RepID=A0AAD8MXA2_9APIA|nr:SWIM-type domain-containing protein [Heracleum sosnowskyi]